MSFRITKPGHREPVESHATMREVQRAFWIVTAQELKHGRVADYRLDDGHGAISACQPHECNPPLPDWAIEVLRQEGFEFP